MKIWITGPLFKEPKAGIPIFERAAEALRAKGHEPVLPQDVPPYRHEGDCPGPRNDWGHSVHCFVRNRIPAMMDCDAVLLLPGSGTDPTSRAERRAASAAGLQLIHSEKDVPFDLSVDPGTAEIIAEVKAMEAGPVLQEDEDWFSLEKSVARDDAYERGLSDGEDAFWRKLGGALSEAGMPKLKSARLLANLAVAVQPEPAYERIGGDRESRLDLAKRMQRHGEEAIRRRGFITPHRATAREVIREMILFVTGVKL